MEQAPPLKAAPSLQSKGIVLTAPSHTTNPIS